uniref:Uncharacterized protein n=1 Tax=Anguilla anguilla TaxID=7936 RepID=A0A0E9UII5_ANGAN
MYFLKCLFLSPSASGTVLYSLKCFCVTLSTCQNNLLIKHALKDQLHMYNKSIFHSGISAGKKD